MSWSWKRAVWHLVRECLREQMLSWRVRLRLIRINLVRRLRGQPLFDAHITYRPSEQDFDEWLYENDRTVIMPGSDLELLAETRRTRE